MSSGGGGGGGGCGGGGLTNKPTLLDTSMSVYSAFVLNYYALLGLLMFVSLLLKLYSQN